MKTKQDLIIEKQRELIDYLFKLTNHGSLGYSIARKKEDDIKALESQEELKPTIEYVFGSKINGTDNSGIMTLTNPPKLICLCPEEHSKLLLNALNNIIPTSKTESKTCHNIPVAQRDTCLPKDKSMCNDCEDFY